MYRVISNTVRNLTRKDHRDHLEDITKDLTKTPRLFWRWLKNARGHGSRIPDLHLSGRVISSGQEKAEAFGEYFRSMFTQEDTNNAWKLKEELMSTRSEVKIEEVALTEDEVCEELHRIDPSKASGPDKIPGRLLREGAPWIASPLCRLFKGSLISGCFLQNWTRANITPVFKKGNKHHPRNYQPVSLTCLVVKVLERLIHRQVVRFLNDNKKINVAQYGFRKAHSCQTQLLETIHQRAENLDRGTSTHAVFLDFGKAFESVPHERLLLKLDHVGVRGELFRWIKAFLSNRQQRVPCNGCPSTWSRVVSGAPQGFILGPLLFLIYVNDIGDNLTSHSRLFPDNCVIYREISESSGCSTMQEDVARVYEWTQKWQLALLCMLTD